MNLLPLAPARVLLAAATAAMSFRARDCAMVRWLVCWLGLVGGGVLAGAAPLEAELGDGLRYHRVLELPADLPAAAKPAPLVLDLRYLAADLNGASAFEAWLKFRPAAAPPLLILVNRETASLLHGLLAAHKTAGGILTIGIAHPEFPPDLVVKTAPEAERRAFDAAACGTAPEALITRHTPKPRTDESSLMRDRANLPGEPDADRDLTLSDDRPADSAAPFDAALERAVQVYRTLRALQRI